MSRAYSIQNSQRTPAYLNEYADSVSKRAAESEKTYSEAYIKKGFADGVMSREAFSLHVDSSYHGHGVREAMADGSIWEESGGKIYRKQECQREVEAVLKLINESTGEKE